MESMKLGEFGKMISMKEGLPVTFRHSNNRKVRDDTIVHVKQIYKNCTQKRATVRKLIERVSKSLWDKNGKINPVVEIKGKKVPRQTLVKTARNSELCRGE